MTQKNSHATVAGYKSPGDGASAPDPGPYACHHAPPTAGPQVQGLEFVETEDRLWLIGIRHSRAIDDSRQVPGTSFLGRVLGVPRPLPGSHF